MYSKTDNGFYVSQEINANFHLGKKNISVEIGGSGSAILRMNGTDTPGLFNTTAYGKLGGTGNIFNRLEVGYEYTFTFRNYFGSGGIASKFTNITGRHKFSFSGPKSNVFTIGWENDGNFNTFISKYYDGGFTNSFQMTYFSQKNPELLFEMRLDMFTPQRPGGPNGDGRGDFRDGGFLTRPGSIWSNGGQGFYDSKDFAGNFAHPMTIGVTKSYGRTTLTIRSGVDSHYIGSFIQGKIHELPLIDVPEFPWDITYNKLIFGVTLKHKIL